MNTGQYAVPSEAIEPVTGELSPAMLFGAERSAAAPDGALRITGTFSTHLVAAERSEILNRMLNLLIAFIALIVLAPVMLLIALAVKITSRGPIFYVQDRVGVDRRRRSTSPQEDRRTSNVGGRPFRILKFRSMRQDAESGTGAVWATKHDPRVTYIGSFLRTTRLDELPQLINVVLGDMNIVGPRPERPSIFAELRQNIEGYHLRQWARPGITGWAQINHSYDTSIDDVRVKIKLDLEYLARQSLAEDLKIMMRTLPVMIFKRGAQ
jgi:lipopolysaccharide/colanic/teichoic acid biosynthesis glycosyltransferase